MKTSDFMPSSPGELVVVSASEPERGVAFLPDLLSSNPPLHSSTWALAEEASFALGNLNALGKRLPNPAILARPFIRKEALASSRIEGTRAEYEQMILFEVATDEREDSDLQEVRNHIRTMDSAWNASGAISVLSIVGIAAMHTELLEGVRGGYAHPGKYRTDYVMIGKPGDTLASARLVPCPPQDTRSRLDNLLSYIRSPGSDLPLLVQLAISHYQFEVIHPFNDGNGRIGRMLLPLIMNHWGRLDTPILYLSEYLERHREQYIDLLHRISTHGDWQAWIEFFLNAVRVQANDAYQRGSLVLDLRESFRARYKQPRKARAIPILNALFEQPSLTYSLAQEITGLTTPASNAIVKMLVEDGVLTEMTGRSRNQVFYAPEIARVSMGLSSPE